MSSLPFDLESALHRHAAALRQLAADLLGHADADDAVQEV
jgi:DNA-directed RNA polymerase specialized sigma24 family protein